jgi:hypothetical protein
MKRGSRSRYRLATLQYSIITIMTALTVDAGMASGEKDAQFINERLADERLKSDALLRQAGPVQIPVGVNAVIGQPADAIQQCAGDYGIDLVAIGCQPSPQSQFQCKGKGT